ncbi:MAG: GntR family transcriptional regulator [Marinosulfonomonas sp.]|nr:GntR family transcriptional regulator [Marinosulfonomonas sp.]
MPNQARNLDAVMLAHDRVYRTLRVQIMHGELEPGISLTLRGIGKQFGVSMTPAREAVRRLVAEGALSLSASGRVSTPDLSNERIEELASVRALLEPELASRALPRAHIALIERLSAINSTVSEVVAKGDAVGYIRTNLEFHRTIYLRAQAPAMLAMAETVWLQLGPTMRKLYGRMQRTEAPFQHRAILTALRAGDEQGLKAAIRNDVAGGLRMLVG